MPGYDGSLLRFAVDLGDRLVPAFETPYGIPLSWINLDKVVALPSSRHRYVNCPLGLHESRPNFVSNNCRIVQMNEQLDQKSLKGPLGLAL